VAREQRQVSGPFFEEEGLVGVFTREHADGAIPNGSVVEKINATDSDLAPEGAKGIIVGSLDAEEHSHHIGEMTGTPHDREEGEKFVYFVQWEIAQPLVVGIRETRVKLLEGEPQPFDPDSPEEPKDPAILTAAGQTPFEMIDMGNMTMLPPAPDVCQVCAAPHADGEPHTPNSLFWQAKRMTEGLDPATWEDALVDCIPEVRESWITALELKGLTIDREKLSRLLAEREGE
jgi:hypothetical protein